MILNELDKTGIIRGVPFKFNEKSNCTFIFRNPKWNDSGYYTLYILVMYIFGTNMPFEIAHFRILNKGQQPGQFPSDSNNYPYVFINDLSSAEGLLYFLSLTERHLLENKLSICFNTKEIKSEPAFKNSVLRHTNEILFNKTQERIKELLHCQIDFKKIIENNKDQLLLYLSVLSKN